jgi:hypothetical protein
MDSIPMAQMRSNPMVFVYSHCAYCRGTDAYVLEDSDLRMNPIVPKKVNGLSPLV